MASIAETRRQLSQRRVEVQQASTQLQEQRKALPQVRSQESLRQKQAGLKGRETRRVVAGREQDISRKEERVKEYKKQIKGAEAKVESYLRTDSGKLQYAKEHGIKAKKFERVTVGRSGDNYAYANIPIYETPYGEVKDFVKEQKAKSSFDRATAYGQAKELGFESVEDMQKGIEMSQLVGGGNILTEKGALNITKGTFTSKQLSPIGVAPVIEQSRVNPFEQQLGVSKMNAFEQLQYAYETQGKPIDYKPDIKETYSSGAGAFVSTAAGVPDVSSSTLVMRPPTIEEKTNIDRAGQQGSFSNIYNTASDKYVTPFIESKPVKTVTGAVLDTPVTLYPGGPKPTLGETALFAKEKAEKATAFAGEGWQELSADIIDATKDKPKVVKNIGETAGYLALGTSYVAKETPTILQYSVGGVVGGAATDILLVEQKKKDVDKYFDKALESSYEQSKEGGWLGTQKEYKEQYGEELKAETLTGISRESTIPFLLLAGGAASKVATKGYTGLTQQRVITGSEVEGRTFNLRYTEKQQATISDLGTTVKSDFKIVTVKTPSSVYTQSHLGKFLKKDPELLVTQRAQTYITQPLGGKAIIGKDYLAVTGRVGSKGNLVDMRLSNVRGRGSNVARESLSKLSKQEQYAWRKTLEKTKKINVPEDKLPAFVSESESLSKGVLEEVKVYSGKLEKPSYYLTSTISKPIGKLESGAVTSKVSTGFKKLSDPKTTFEVSTVLEQSPGKVRYDLFTKKRELLPGETSRAAGKIDILEGVVIRKKPIVIEGAGESNMIVGTGKKSSPGYLKQLYQEQKVIPISKPSIKIPKAQPPAKVQAVLETELPLMVGGKGLKTVPYAKTGIYESTQTTTTLQPLGTEGVISPAMSYDTLSYDAGLKLNYDTLSYDAGLKVDQEIKTDLGTKGVVAIKQLIKEKQMFKERTKLDQADIQAFKLGLKQKAKQKLQTKQIVRQVTKQTTKQKPKPKKPGKIIPPPIPTSLVKKLAKKVDEEPGLFEVFTRKGGEDIRIAKKGTVGAATKVLKSSLSKTLRASGFIKKGGSKIKVSSLKLGRTLRVSRVDPYRVVEKKSKRIKRGGGEASEIQMFRKSGSKKKKKGYFGF